ncbi:MAG: hypothetical protein IPK58_11895 [Acidobacteria bacterium]|nr:hypothetical protein [Acidobacteriota bacterium]
MGVFHLALGAGRKLPGIASGSDDLLPIGDPPLGILEDVKYDGSSGNISFRTSLKIKGARSKIRSHTVETIVFRGKIRGLTLTGKLLIVNEQCGSPCNRTIDVVLRFSKELSSIERDFADSAEWNNYVNEIMGSG